MNMKRRRGQAPRQKIALQSKILLPLILAVAMCTMIVLARMQASVQADGSLAREFNSKEEIRKGKIEENYFIESPVQSKSISTDVIGETTTLVECVVMTPLAKSSDTAANGVIQITVRNDLSPIASKVFVDLVNAQYYDGVFIFRVLRGFIAQFGFHDKWTKTTKPPKTKDAVQENTLSNVRGTLSFAGGNPAVQQVFVNLGDNARLDKEDSYPFATLSEESMDVMDKLYMDYKDGQGQIKALQKDGDGPVLELFPEMSKVESCRVVSAFSR